MGKINKYANIYDEDGELIRHVNKETGELGNYTLEELEELVDKLAEMKDENGKIKNPQAFNNASYMLMQYYQKYGNPHANEILEKMKQKSEQEQLADALNDVMEELKEEVANEKAEEVENSDEIVHQTESNLNEEYVEFEEVK